MGGTARRHVLGSLSESETDLDRPHCTAPPHPLRRCRAASTVVVSSTLCPIPFVGDAASPPDIAHLPTWDYIAMLSEDGRNAVDRGEDWVESAADNSWIKPG